MNEGRLSSPSGDPEMNCDILTAIDRMSRLSVIVCGGGGVTREGVGYDGRSHSKVMMDSKEGRAKRSWQPSAEYSSLIQARGSRLALSESGPERRLVEKAAARTAPNQSSTDSYSNSDSPAQE